MGPEDKLKELGLELPQAVTPVANYVPAVRSGNMVYVSGHGPGPEEPRGKVGRDLTLEEGYQAARSAALRCLSSLKATVGNLDRVKRVVKVVGFVNSGEGFTDQPKVVNGASDLLVQVFGDRGKHARSAVGMYELPGNIAAEIELIAEVEG